MKQWLISLTAVLVSLALTLPGHSTHAQGVDGSDWDDHWLVAACPIAQGYFKSRVRETRLGPAVEFRPNWVGKIVLYCNVEPDSFATSFVMWAEDDSEHGMVEASLYRQHVQGNQVLLDDLGEPVQLVNVQSTDGSGVRTFQTDFDPLVDETLYMYYVKIVLTRTNPEAVVRVYNVNWMVLF